MHRIKKLMSRLTAPFRPQPGRSRAQSFVELALVLPILLLLLLGVVEISIFIGRYMDVLDLTREAARFASVREPSFKATPVGPTPVYNCSTPEPFNFYYHSACMFSPPSDSGVCSDARFCNGLNPYIHLDQAVDDVVISVYTVSDESVQNPFPKPLGYWAFSDYDSDTSHNANWTKNCKGTPVRAEPYYNRERVATLIAPLYSGSTETVPPPPNKGFVAIEFYYCHEQVLDLPLFTNIVPNPIQIHAYTIMPLPAAAPSPTPKASATP